MPKFVPQTSNFSFFSSTSINSITTAHLFTHRHGKASVTEISSPRTCFWRARGKQHYPFPPHRDHSTTPSPISTFSASVGFSGGEIASCSQLRFSSHGPLNFGFPLPAVPPSASLFLRCRQQRTSHPCHSSSPSCQTRSRLDPQHHSSRSIPREISLTKRCKKGKAAQTVLGCWGSDLFFRVL